MSVRKRDIKNSFIFFDSIKKNLGDKSHINLHQKVKIKKKMPQRTK